MQSAVEKSGCFFQMGFMRRFDPGYAAAKKQVDEGRIGQPVVFKSSSRDPFPPSIEYANPASSGGILVDMGIHDFDLARWFMGDVARSAAIGGVLVFPELGKVGDLDNAITSLVFTNGRLGVIDITRNGVYGYDIQTELLGSEGTVKIGYIQETPVTLFTKGNVAHDTVPYFMERFERAYTRQLQNFAQNVLADREPPVTDPRWHRGAPGGARGYTGLPVGQHRPRLEHRITKGNRMAAKIRLQPRTIADRRSGVTVGVTPKQAGWQFVRFAVHQLAARSAWRSAARREEICLVLLEGYCDVECDGAAPSARSASRCVQRLPARDLPATADQVRGHGHEADGDR